MAYRLWISLLMLPVLVHSQSGGHLVDNEPRILCTSHISISANSLTCHFDDDTDDDDYDDEMEDIKAMSLCYKDDSKQHCLTENGNNVTFTNLDTLQSYNLTVQLKRGGIFLKTVNLRKIIKPRSPWVVNATFLRSSHRALIYIGIPYLSDYLQHSNQLFQFRIWSVKNTLVKNITYQPLIIEGGEYLYKNTEYHVKVRAKPTGGYFDGSWSEWSTSLSFSTNAETDVQALSLIVPIAALLLVILAVGLFWRKQIHSFIWPSIPHPKHTLLHIAQTYEPIKHGPPVSFNPEVFSDLNIQLVKPYKQQDLTAQPPDSDSHRLAEVKDQCLIQECDGDMTSCHITSSGGSEAILLRCKSPGEYLDSGAGSSENSGSTVGILDLRSDIESMETDDSDGNIGPEELGATQQGGKDEAYVTMSSFYQIQ